MVALLRSLDVDEIRHTSLTKQFLKSHSLGDSQQPEWTIPQQPVQISSQEETKTLAVLVNEGSNLESYTLD